MNTHFHFLLLIFLPGNKFSSFEGSVSVFFLTRFATEKFRTIQNFLNACSPHPSEEISLGQVPVDVRPLPHDDVPRMEATIFGTIPPF